MKRLVVFILSLLMLSCNPRMHIIGVGMRHHNLSQNKYQPGKHRKKVKVGRHQNSPLFWILRNK